VARLVSIVLLALGLAGLAAGPGVAEQAGAGARSFQSGTLDAGSLHTCAVLSGGAVRCWGYGFTGALGQGGTATIGDDEAPAAAGPVDLGPDRTAKAIAAGGDFTCALLDDATVRCWGGNGSGQLGLGNATRIGDDEKPAAAPAVDLGPGRLARAITAGGSHACAILDDGSVRCWGEGDNGRLGLGTTQDIGDDETPGSVPPVNLGPGRTAKAIAAGSANTCAILDDGSVRCWGAGGSGRLGLGGVATIGDDESPAAVPPVDLGAGRTAVAITAGDLHTCALLDDASVRCWGEGSEGRLGLGNTQDVGDDERPGQVGTVDLGPGRTARAIAAGGSHTCAVRDDGTVLCWGDGGVGALGYGTTDDVGDDESPASLGLLAPVPFGPLLANGQRRRVTGFAITAGSLHTCVATTAGEVRCWGLSADGELGYGNTATIGDDDVMPLEAVNVGGTLPTAAADLSLALAADPGGSVGSPLTLTATIRNEGPDAAPGVGVSFPVPAGTQLVGAAPSQGTYDPASGSWQAGLVSPGSAATLALTARPTAGGALSAIAEVSASGLVDPDSTPANGAPREDDRAGVTVAVIDTRPPPPVLRLDRATIEGGWKASKLTARLRLRGAALAAGTVRIDLRRVSGPSGKGLVTRAGARVRLAKAGKLDRRVGLPARLAPGRYVLTATRATVGPRAVAVRLARPKEGIVLRAFATRRPTGPAAVSVGFGTRQLSAHFAFALSPSGGGLIARWRGPAGPVAPVGKARARVVTAEVTGSQALPRGRWTCTLLNRGRVVAVVRVAIR
jgi:uncharacterized repeat protein (TIGR01451 family)